MFRKQGTPKSKKNAFREQGKTKKLLLGTREHGRDSIILLHLCVKLTCFVMFYSESNVCDEANDSCHQTAESNVHYYGEL